MPQLYSDQNHFWRPDSGLVSEAIPIQVRNGIRRILVPPTSMYGRNTRLLTYIVTRMNLDPSLVTRSGDRYLADSRNQTTLNKILKSVKWFSILDICTSVFEYYESSSTDQQEYRDEINELFVRYYSAYLMAEDGSIYRPGSEAAESAISESRSLLTNSRFVGPDRQFQEALLAFHRSVNPSYEIAVDQAVSSVEGVARIVLNDPSTTLGKALKPISEQKKLHPALRAMIDRLYGFASDGPRHGLVGEATIDRTLAEYVLTVSAATIVLFARLYSVDIKEGGNPSR